MSKTPGRNPPDLSGITVMELAPLAVKRRFRVTGATTGEEAVDALTAMVKDCDHGCSISDAIRTPDGVPNVWFVDVSPNAPPEPDVDSPEIVELDCPGANREFQVKGVASANMAVVAVQRKYEAMRLGDMQRSLVVGGLMVARMEGAPHSWLVQIVFVSPTEPVERRPDPPPCFVDVSLMPWVCSGCGKALNVLGSFHGTPIYGHKTFSECSLPKPTPAPPLPPEQEAMLLVGDYPICSVCWAQGTKDRLLVGCREGRCSQGLRVCAIREIRAQLRVLQAASKPLVTDRCKWAGTKECPSCMYVTTCRDVPESVKRVKGPPLCSGCDKPLDVVDMIEGATVYGHKTGVCEGNPTKEILAKLERVPCMSKDCDGPEYHVPDARDGLPNTRCNRCAAVRLARSALGNG